MGSQRYPRDQSIGVRGDLSWDDTLNPDRTKCRLGQREAAA